MEIKHCGVIAIAAGIAVVAFTVFSLRERASQAGWIKTSAVVNDRNYSWSRSKRRDDSGRAYFVEHQSVSFDYLYEVNGKTYKGIDSMLGDNVDLVPQEGETMTIWYDPSTPAKSTARLANTDNAWNAILIGGLSCGIGVFLLRKGNEVPHGGRRTIVSQGRRSCGAGTETGDPPD